MAASATTAAAPPPPPPNSAKPLPPPQVPGTHLSNASNHQLPATNGSSSASAAAARISVASNVADRRYVNPSAPGAAPPIVVVSPEVPATEDRLGGDNGPVTPPRVGALATRGLRPAPKDTIPISGKPPRKQRSSRFIVNEKVEIERLPAFSGARYSSASSR